jgi:3-deoxy-manno-octulosonate cytidylyltransferase (CMP-KDO synthetase)
MRVVLVIPARFESTRFPGKPLADLFGRPLIQHVYEQACTLKIVDRVIVATDDERILKTVKGFSGEAYLTSNHARTGSDRIAELAQRMKAELFVNLQGDELLLDPEMLVPLITLFLDQRSLKVGSLMRTLDSERDFTNPNIVKVVSDQEGFALYFSRASIPFFRSHSMPLPLKNIFHHLGIYIYRRKSLLEFSGWPTGILEDFERLEQLRFLEHGFKIKLLETAGRSLRIDVPEDLKAAEAVLNQKEREK